MRNEAVTITYRLIWWQSKTYLFLDILRTSSFPDIRRYAGSKWKRFKTTRITGRWTVDSPIRTFLTVANYFFTFLTIFGQSYLREGKYVVWLIISFEFLETLWLHAIETPPRVLIMSKHIRNERNSHYVFRIDAF